MWFGVIDKDRLIHYDLIIFLCVIVNPRTIKNVTLIIRNYKLDNIPKILPTKYRPTDQF